MKSRKWAASVAVLALLAAACGGSDDGETSDTDTAAESSEPASEDADSSESASSSESSEETSSESESTAPVANLEGTLRVLIHQNPSGVEFFEQFNDEFEAAHPGVTIDLSVVNADDLPTVNQTRLTASDIDVTTLSVTGFANPVQPYMTDAEAPYWQQLIEAGLLMDLAGEDFLSNYDDAAVESTSFGGGTYGVTLGRVTYSGTFVNEDVLADAGVSMPTTFSELVDSCGPIEDAGYKCMIAGGADGWPIFVGTYGLLGAMYPDQQGLVEDLWTGAAAWDDAQGIELFNRYATFAGLLDDESAGLGGDAAASRFAVGDIAYGPMGGWNAWAVEDSEFEWEYIPFPGSEDAADNQTFFGKNDMTLGVAADTDVPDIAKAYLAAFSEPSNYNAFANATNYLPTQPTAELESRFGASIAPILQAGNFAVGFEQFWVGPAGAGQWANGSFASLWMYNGDFNDPVEAAEASQADLEAGL
jgi:raffinose/stachyose/melibiose transport system substrate-binding protein